MPRHTRPILLLPFLLLAVGLVPGPMSGEGLDRAVVAPANPSRMLAASGAPIADGPEASPIETALTLPPATQRHTWRLLVLAYSEIEVTWPQTHCGPSGSYSEVRGRPTEPPSADYLEAVSAVRRLPAVITDWSAGRLLIEQKVVEVTHPIGRVTVHSGCEFEPTTKDLTADIATNATKGRYDGILVIWPDAGKVYHADAWGLTIGASDGANGAAYTTVSVLTAAAWAEAAEPAEVYVHEVLHQILDAAVDAGAEDIPDLHRNRAWGYDADEHGSYRTWYQAILQATIPADGRRLDGGLTMGEDSTPVPVERLGLTDEVWQAMDR